jgi:acyl dehydratase
MTTTVQPRGRYFEDFEIGEEFISPARTITSTDIVNFACLTGDFNEVHTNFEYCKTTPFGEPIAHGPLIYGIMGGLQYASGVNDGTMLGCSDRQLAHAGPVKHGDTIRLVQKVVEKKESSKPDRGVVSFQRQCVKQDGTVVQEMKATLMYKRRPDRGVLRRHALCHLQGSRNHPVGAGRRANRPWLVGQGEGAAARCGQLHAPDGDAAPARHHRAPGDPRRGPASAGEGHRTRLGDRAGQLLRIRAPARGGPPLLAAVLPGARATRNVSAA